MFKFFNKPFTNVKEFTDMTGSSVKDVFAGNILTKENLTNQWKLVLLLVFLTFGYIGNRYSCEQKIAEIDRLQKKLIDVKFEALTRSSELMEMGKQSQVHKLIDYKNINLTESTTPPYRIKSE
ncbi:MAG: hypothetical protein LBR52_02380 [Prevotellaceae bacterium]|jgi:hypothetical protein|nr:hypothetical protein [Prevotellaceae bacterium]